MTVPHGNALARRQSLHAFTLVELSIVLVILGLLVGGVLTGQSLIHAAEIRSISTQFGNYVAATHSFRDKYFALPGDMNNAQSFWGVAHATPATCNTTASTTATTCNGDGDGMIEPNTSGANEVHRFWQHLANAGLIEGSYTGVAGSAGAWHSIVSVNCPASKIPQAGWSVSWLGSVSGNPVVFDANYGNYLMFGMNTATQNDTMNDPIIRAEDAWNIDTKLDDGRPNSGIVVTYKVASRPGCANAGNTAYDLAATTNSCNLVFPHAVSN